MSCWTPLTLTFEILGAYSAVVLVIVCATGLWLGRKEWAGTTEPENNTAGKLDRDIEQKIMDEVRSEIIRRLGEQARKREWDPPNWLIALFCVATGFLFIALVYILTWSGPK